MEKSQNDVSVRIKQRDRWTCKICGNKFVDLVACPFKIPITGDDCYITLCEGCVKEQLDNPDCMELCGSLVRRNKVVLLGDCHGGFDKLDAVLSNEEPFDFFISVGDVGTLRNVTPHNMEVIDRWQNGYFIRGNHDDVDFFTPIGLSQEINGLHVAGLNGILRSRTFIKDQPNNVSFREVLYLSHLKDVDILVTHQPPTGLINGMGESVLEELLNYLVPKIYISGHVHQYKLKFYLQTFVMSLPMVDQGYVVAHFQGKDLRNIEVVLRKGKRFIRV